MLSFSKFPLEIDNSIATSLWADYVAAVEASLRLQYDGMCEEHLKSILALETGPGGRPFQVPGISKRDMRHFMFAQLLTGEPNAPKAHLAATPEIRDWIAASGRILFNAGGIELMRDVYYAVKERLHHAGQLSRGWDGIGDWRH
jgi:hypothetical protein